MVTLPARVKTLFSPICLILTKLDIVEQQIQAEKLGTLRRMILSFILRSSNGFGFTVRGDAPVLVANVEGNELEYVVRKMFSDVD